MGKDTLAGRDVLNHSLRQLWILRIIPLEIVNQMVMEGLLQLAGRYEVVETNQHHGARCGGAGLVLADCVPLNLQRFREVSLPQAQSPANFPYRLRKILHALPFQRSLWIDLDSAGSVSRQLMKGLYIDLENCEGTTNDRLPHETSDPETERRPWRGHPEHPSPHESRTGEICTINRSAASHPLPIRVGRSAAGRWTAY